MGFRVENYSLNELHRIAVPGAVAPSLFWVLPVGDWRPRDLEEVWRWFTERPGECNDFGLLLVKDMGRREDDEANVSLASVGANLFDLMPVGAERFVRPSAYRGESPRVLVLSGGYPQPGWGVLVEWRRGGVREFEKLIGRVTAQLSVGSAGGDLNVFRDAAQSFHRWRDPIAFPPKPNVSGLESEISAAEKVEGFIREARTALEAEMHRLVGEKLNAADHALRQAAWLSVPVDSIQALLDTQRKLLVAGSVLAVSKEILATEIEPKLAALIADPSQGESIFRSLPSDEAKHALKACRHLRTHGIVGETEDFQACADRILVEIPPTLATELGKLSGDIDAKLIIHRGAKAQREHEYDVAMGSRRERSKEARETYHAAAGKAVELQWQLGPQFLAAFEHFCKQQGLWVRSIPWDPARMVGWKIMTSQVKLRIRDLQIAAGELMPGSPVTSPVHGSTTSVADGSYFTDYVHHIAISKPGFSPRAVTRDLLARLLRPAEMMDLIQAHGEESPKAADAPQLAEELLQAFGWRQMDGTREKPLAGCVRTGNDATPLLAENLSGNDLRVVLESFCKDIVDVVVGQIGYDHAEVWSAIEERIPAYRPSSRTKDWDEEVRLMTTGGAVMVLPALGPLAFPAQANEIKEFTITLRKLAELLNKASHHREGEPAPSATLDDAPSLIHQLLGKAEAFLGELPWHLDASFVYGEQPKVLSGEAWSHGSPAPRLLRVIVWSGSSPGSHVTFWNKTRRNPIVTDPVFIARPRKCK